MHLHQRSYVYRIILAVGSLVCFVLAIVLWGRHSAGAAHNQSPALDSSGIGAEAADYLKQGRYDEAVEVSLRSLKNEPSDEIIYDQLAIVYLVRAQKDEEQRERWVATAVSYIDKGLSLNSKERDTGGVHLLLHARNLEIAGDVSVKGRCTYYARARGLLEARVPLLQGDQLMLEGKSYPLAPLRRENDRALEAVTGKAAKAGCK